MHAIYSLFLVLLLFSLEITCEKTLATLAAVIMCNNTFFVFMLLLRLFMLL